MAKKKFYAVRKGFKPGIYLEWKDCEAQTRGFSNAEYQGFTTLEEAEKFMASMSEDEANNLTENQEDIEAINDRIENMINNLNDGEVIAFVDGSFNAAEEKAGYGVIILTNDGNEERLYRAITDKLDRDFIKLNNIAPELEAVKQAVNWAIQNQKQKITIFHDLEGTAKWANGEFKAKNPFTKEYVSFVAEKRKKIEVVFSRVPGHHGIKYNEEADKLAKQSLLEKGYKNYDDGSVYFVGISIDDWRAISELINEENLELQDACPVVSFQSEVLNEYRTKLVLQQGNNKVTINYYPYEKSYVQGKHSALLQRILATAISLLEKGEIVIETYNKYHAVEIDREEVEIKFNELLPNYTGDIQSKHYLNLLSAVYNTMLTGYRPDYTHLITPVFRSYEYYLHRILADKMGLTTTNANGTNNFGFFSKDQNGAFECNSPAVSCLNSDQVDYLNDLYTNYNRIRHPYSHWAYEDVDCSVITKMTEARDLIVQGLQMFDKYYTCF